MSIAYTEHFDGPSGPVKTARMSFSVIFCFLPIVAYIVSFSRILLLFTDRIATVNVVGGILCITCMILVRGEQWSKVALFSALVLTLGIVFEIVFIANTGLIGDFRALGALLGDLTVIPFTVIIQRVGVEKTIRWFANIVFIYLVVYIVVSVPILTGEFLPKSAVNSTILHDPGRGYRLFACYSLMAFGLFYVLIQLRARRQLIKNILLLPVVVAAIIMDKERVAQALCLLLAISFIILPRRLIILFGTLYIFVYVLACLILYDNFNLIADLIRTVNDSSLQLRLDSVFVAANVFSQYPLFGLGFPTDENFHQQVLGFPYFPVDLGIMGQFASMGAAGPIFLTFLCIMIARAIRLGFARSSPELHAACLTGLYLMFTTAVTLTIYLGEGGVACGLLLACLFTMTDRSRQGPTQVGHPTGLRRT